MGATGDVWAEASGTIDAAEREGAEVVEATLSWGDARSGNVLAVKQVPEGGTLAIGDDADLLVPGEVLGLERFEVLRFEGGSATMIAPPGAEARLDGWVRTDKRLELATGHVAELRVGAFWLRLVRTRAGARIGAAPLQDLRRGGAGIVLASALAHAAAFAVLAYVSPALGATEDDAYDPDRILLMQKMLDASAEREAERTPDTGAASHEGGGPSAPAARGAEGQAGKDVPNRDGHWAARGTAKPEDVTLARERALFDAAHWDVLGMLASMNGDPNAPTVPWGTRLDGADAMSKIGHLYGLTLDDAMGTGGLGLSGPGPGGGGPSDFIGLGDDIGGLGTRGRCVGGGPCEGIGVGSRGPGTRGHVPRPPHWREVGPVTTNGRLPADVIQRIVRQNAGRYVFCYQNALRANPNLAGRVTVKFVIDRSGAVALAADGGSDIPDTGVRRCVISSFTQLSFPSPEGGMVTVVYPLMFTPE